VIKVSEDKSFKFLSYEEYYSSLEKIDEKAFHNELYGSFTIMPKHEEDELEVQ